MLAFLPARAQASPGLKIGVIGDMSSTYADVAGKGSVLATMMAAEDFGGSVLGGPITVVSADALNKPDLALSLARQWWDAEGVDAIADVPTSAIALALMTLSAEKQKVAAGLERRVVFHHWRILFALHDAMDLRFLCNGQLHRPVVGRTGRETLVFYRGGQGVRRGPSS